LDSALSLVTDRLFSAIFWQEMKIQIPKSKDFTQSREGAKSIAKKTFAYSLRLCDLRALLIFFFWFRLVWVRHSGLQIPNQRRGSKVIGTEISPDFFRDGFRYTDAPLRRPLR
jgi:hypothetical protein